MDLKMGMGKIAAQCAHAILRAFQIGRTQAEKDVQFTETFISWLEKGKKQVFLKV
jgi:peptidyl-tRNA hydrolase